MGCRPEHAAQRADVGVGSDAETDAADPLPARLGQRPPSIRLAVGTLVAVVVGEPIGEHDQQPSCRASLRPEGGRAMADRRAQSRVRARHESAQALQHRRVELLVEALDRHDVHRRTPLRSEPVERDAVAELMQGHGQAAGRVALMDVHGHADGAGLPGGSRDVQEHEHGEVTPSAHGVDVDGSVGAESCLQLDERLDGGVDVDVVSLQLTVTPLELHAQPSQRTPQCMGVRRPEGGKFARPRLDLLDRAPIGLVAPPVLVPLGVLRRLVRAPSSPSRTLVPPKWRASPWRPSGWSADSRG